MDECHYRPKMEFKLRNSITARFQPNKIEWYTLSKTLLGQEISNREELNEE